MNNFVNDMKESAYGIYKKHKNENTKKFKNWLNDGIEKKNKNDEKKEKEREREENEKREQENRNIKSDKPSKISKIFLYYFIIPSFIFVISGLCQVCLLYEIDSIVPNENYKFFNDYRPFKWSVNDPKRTWFGEWFGIWQRKSWGKLGELYKKYFTTIQSLYVMLNLQKSDDITTTIGKNFSRLGAIWVMGLIFSLIWISQFIISSFMNWIYLFLSMFYNPTYKTEGKNYPQKEYSMIEMIFSGIIAILSSPTTVFLTSFSQLFYFPYLLWKNYKSRKKMSPYESFFEPFDMIGKSETDGGFMTGILLSLIFAFSTFFFLWMNNTGLILFITIFLFGLIVASISIYKFYKVITLGFCPKNPSENKSKDEILKTPNEELTLDEKIYKSAIQKKCKERPKSKKMKIPEPTALEMETTEKDDSAFY